MSDFEARIEKYFEGTSLGLAAVADVLSKMDDRFEKADQEEYDEFQKEQAFSERHELIKEVIAEIKKEGAEYDLDLKIDPKSVGGTASTDNDKSAGDASETTSFDNKTETAGASIQAEDDEMAEDGEDDEDNGDEENGDEDVGAMIRSMEKALAKLSLMYKGHGDEEEDDEMSSEYPQDEEKSFDQSITKSLGTDVKNIMAKMGIKESGSTQVKRVALSPEISPSEAFISKSNNGEQSVDFTKLTYKELRRLEDGIRNGSITEVEL
jgi:hypothetical protein|tara:strand:- start:29 stop:826 length:798 start_codon:yes stop_codon:yes gene_type:complete